MTQTGSGPGEGTPGGWGIPEWVLDLAWREKSERASWRRGSELKRMNKHKPKGRGGKAGVPGEECKSAKARKKRASDATLGK